MAKTKPFASRTDRLQAMNAALDRELGRLSQQVGSSQSALLTEMVQYHLGLRKSGDRPGKRLRANLALLTCEAFGRRYADALWAAVAVELVHNFSLVFDDVQDHDELRRGRPSVWKVWGTGQAINAGHDTDRRDRHLPPAQRPHVRVGDPPDGGEHRVEVVHRLAHAHKDKRREPPARGGRRFPQVEELLDDLAGGEVALQAAASAGAEVAPHRAADL